MRPQHLGVAQRHRASHQVLGEWKPAAMDSALLFIKLAAHSFSSSIARFPLIITIMFLPTMTDVQPPLEPVGHWMPLAI